MNKFDKYLRCTDGLRKRYTKGKTLILTIGGNPTKYTRLEKLAAKKYLAI